MKRVAIGTILFLFAALGILCFLLWPSKAVISPDSDLRLSRVLLPNGSNTCYYLAEAARVMALTDDEKETVGKLLSANGWNQTTATNILAQNKETIAVLQKALACPAAQVPELISATNEYPYLSDWRTLTSLLGIKAMALANDGQGNNALELSMDIVRLGHRLENADGATMHWLVASAIKSAGLQRMREIVASTSFDASTALSFSKQLADYPVNGLGLTNSLKREYMLSVLWMDDLRSGRATSTNALEQAGTSVGMSVMMNQRKLSRLFAEATRAALKAAPIPSASLPKDWFPAPQKRSNWRLLFSGNAVGQTLFEMWQPSLLSVINRKSAENVHVAATRTLLALRGYKLAHGDLPDSLARLVPEYLPAIPIDDCSGLPLIYVKEKRILYSVGNDLKDSGGIERDANRNRLDIVFPISF